MSESVMGVEDWSLPLIHTKMSPPRLARNRIGRAALLDRLAQARQRRLTSIVAAAGFGKTSVLSEWHSMLREQGQVVGWLSLDEDDDDTHLLGRYVVAALNGEPGGVGRRAARLLAEDPLTPIKTVVAVLLNEIHADARDVFLFLDDFERVNSRQSLALVSRLLRYAPANLHLLIGSRREPAERLTNFGVPQQILGLDADALRFSNEDAQAYFSKVDGLSLDRTSVELLNAASEGWVTGLQLASLALRDTADSSRLARELAATRLVAESYLYETVLSKMPEPVHQFVLRTSILDRLSPGVCDAVMGGGARSWEKLEWLVKHNLFIRPLDERGQWLRFHTLMSDALRRRAQQRLGPMLPALHRRASLWFASQGLWPEAVRHALAAGDVEQAAQWAEGCAAALIGRSDVPTLLGWFSKLPAQLVQRSAGLRLAKAWGLTLSFRIPEAKGLVQELLDEQRSPGGAQRDRVPALVAETGAVNALIAGFSDDTPRSLELWREAEQSLPDAPKWARRFAQTSQIFGLAYDGQFDEVRRIRAAASPDAAEGESIYSNVYRESMVGLSAFVEGSLHEATEIFERTLRRAESSVGRDAAAAAVPAGYLVALHYERGDMEAAADVMNGRTVVAFAACPLGSLLRFCRGTARTYARRGDTASALTLLEEARGVATQRDWLRLRAGCDAEAVHLLLRAQRLQEAERMVAQLRGLLPERHPHPAGSFVETWASYCMAAARLAMAQGHPDEAVRLLDAAREQAHGAGMRYLGAVVALLSALAQQQRADEDAALRVLDQAVRYAAAQPMVSSFLDEGPRMLGLLDRLRRHARYRDLAHVRIVDGLLAGQVKEAAMPPGAAQGKPASSGVLSSREVEILSHISKGLSNKEIARAMRVAPETIKWHLKNIFEKLNVASRIEAVQTGLGLVPARRF